MNSRTVINFWENSGNGLPHIDPNKGIAVIKGFEKYIAQIFDFKRMHGKTVIDYGCGGGFIAEHIAKKFGISKYIGYDILQRSIDAAAAKIHWTGIEYEFHLVNLDKPLSFPSADFFICLAVIQHFHSKDFFEEFLTAVNKSGIKTLILQIRAGSHLNFSDDFTNSTGVLLACQCTINDVTKLLPDYVLVKFSEIYERSRYQFIIFEMK